MSLSLLWLNSPVWNWTWIHNTTSGQAKAAAFRPSRARHITNSQHCHSFSSPYYMFSSPHHAFLNPTRPSQASTTRFRAPPLIFKLEHPRATTHLWAPTCILNPSYHLFSSSHRPFSSPYHAFLSPTIHSQALPLVLEPQPLVLKPHHTFSSLEPYHIFSSLHHAFLSPTTPSRAPYQEMRVRLLVRAFLSWFFFFCSQNACFGQMDTINIK